MIQELLSSASPVDLKSALRGAVYWDTDRKWAESLLIRFASHQDPQVIEAVASGSGLLAAFHGEIDLDAVEPILRNLATTASAPEIAQAAKNSLDEIDHFVRRRQAGDDIDLAERMPE